MAASDFPAYVAQGYEAGTYVDEFVPAQGTNEPWIVGDFVFISTGESGEAERCAADPTLIAGISETDSERHRLLTPSGKVPLRILTGASVVLHMASATQFAYATHVGNSYGITRETNGHWRVDTAKTTTSSRVRVVGGDVAKNIWKVILHQNLLQFADLTVATS